jgi:hypothetical protein
LTEKAKTTVRAIRELEDRNANLLAEHEVSGEDLDAACRALRNVEHAWANYIQSSGQ